MKEEITVMNLQAKECKKKKKKKEMPANHQNLERSMEESPAPITA